jgi:hypothetical protein
MEPYAKTQEEKAAKAARREKERKEKAAAKAAKVKTVRRHLLCHLFVSLLICTWQKAVSLKTRVHIKRGSKAKRKKQHTTAVHHVSLALVNEW